jgi:hypothetical protein
MTNNKFCESSSSESPHDNIYCQISFVRIERKKVKALYNDNDKKKAQENLVPLLKREVSSLRTIYIFKQFYFFPRAQDAGEERRK